MFRISLVLATVAGCNSVYLAPGAGSADAERAEHGECLPFGGTFSGIVFTDEEAQNTIDFADNATNAELEVMLGIGPSIANKIVTNRPYGTKAIPMSALDAVPYVGPMLLERFRTESYALWCSLDDGRQGCCIELSCEGLGGTFSGVDVSDADAQMILDWANRASFDELDTVCGVGEAIANDIVASRPMHDVAELDAVPWVGPTLLHRMLGDEGYTCTTRDTVAEAWCDQDGACVCEDTSAPTDPGLVEEIFHEGPWTLPTAVQDAVAGLVARTDWCDPTWPGPTELAGILEHRVDGVTTGYTIDLVQWADDYSFGWAVTVDLDSTGAELGSACLAL